MGDSVTFKVTDKQYDNRYPPKKIVVKDYLQDRLKSSYKGTEVLHSYSAFPNDTVQPSLDNGFVGAAIQAYNSHYHLSISPDDVWITILISLARFIDANAEKVREIFVKHTGKKDLVVYGSGNIQSANFQKLLDDMVLEINKNSNEGITEWAICNFSTTTNISKTISNIALMGAMKNYFSYKMCLMCGLPSVTLKGKKSDWENIKERVKKMSEWKVYELIEWQKVLENVLEHFISAFDNVPKGQELDFWNRIAHYSGGGSGPTFIQGWILAFIGFDNEGKYFLNKLGNILKTNSYGEMETDDVPSNYAEVPVTIDDNGTTYETKFYGGSIASVLTVEGDRRTLSASMDWAIVDFTKATSINNKLKF